MPSTQNPTQLWTLLIQLGVQLTELFDEQNRALGISPSEAEAIRIIGQHPGINQHELAIQLGTVPSRVVVLIDRLEADAIAVRTRNVSDRRNQNLNLTEPGKGVLQTIQRAAETQEQELSENLSTNQKSTLIELLTALQKRHTLPTKPHATHHPLNKGSQQN